MFSSGVLRSICWVFCQSQSCVAYRNREFTKHFRKRQRQLRSFLRSRSRSCYRKICVTKLAVKRGEQKNFILIQDVSETAAKLDIPNLNTVQDMILLTHADHLIDYDEYLLLCDFNRSKNLDLPYHSYEKFDLGSLSEDECKSEFRFDKRGMYRLCDVFEIPEEIRCYNGMVFNKEEALCIFLKRYAYPCRYQDLMLRFGQRAVPQLCMISNQVQNIIYENWGFLMRNMNQNWLSRRNLEFAEIIHTKGAPLDNCWGFVDGTTRPVCCRPG